MKPGIIRSLLYSAWLVAGFFVAAGCVNSTRKAVGATGSCPCVDGKPPVKTAEARPFIALRASPTTYVTGPELKTVETTLCTRPYEVSEWGVCRLPAHVRLMVLPRYLGISEHGQIVDERITVVVADGPNHFWPVIVKMPLEEAERLERSLARTIAEKKSGKDKEGGG